MDIFSSLVNTFIRFFTDLVSLWAPAPIQSESRLENNSDVSGSSSTSGPSFNFSSSGFPKDASDLEAGESARLLPAVANNRAARSESVSMGAPTRERPSRLRNVFADPSQARWSVSELPTPAAGSDNDCIAASHQFLATPVQRGPGSFIVVPLPHNQNSISSHSVRFSDADCAVVNAHKAAVTDLHFSPLDPKLLCSAAEDATVKLWTVPNHYNSHNNHNNSHNSHESSSSSVLSSSVSSSSTLSASRTAVLEAPLCVLRHSRKVFSARMHPSVRALLCSASADGCVKLWDASAQTDSAVWTHGNGANGGGVAVDAQYRDLAWTDANSLVVSSRLQTLAWIDARTGSVSASVRDVFSGNKSIRLAATRDDFGRVIVTGSSKGAMRQVKIWDPRNTSEEVFKMDIDTSSGTLMPFFDADTGLLYLAGKGDANVRYFELSSGGCELKLISEFRSNVATKGMAMVPKRSLDVMSCEINRLLKLTTNSITPLPFYVPRKANSFQDDLYPDVYGDLAPHSFNQWMKGSDQMPEKVSLKPSLVLPKSKVTTKAEGVEFVKSPRITIGDVGNKEEDKTKVELVEKIRKAKMRISVLENQCRKAGINIL